MCAGHGGECGNARRANIPRYELKSKFVPDHEKGVMRRIDYIGYAVATLEPIIVVLAQYQM